MTKSEVIRKIYNEIDNLPPIPENINKIQQLVMDPNADIMLISTFVKQDVGLTANILRTANSPWYMPVTRVNSIERAIALIGLRRLYSIILAIGAKKIIGDRYGSIKDAWKHSYKCAFYAQNLMKSKKAPVEEIEIAYIAGLLHDMGKIVFLSLSRSLLNKITSLSEEKHVSVYEIEKSAFGLSHSEIGGKIAGRWKFPQALVDAIAFHHSPELTSKNNEGMVFTVYLANILCQQEEEYQEESFKKLYPAALEYYNILSERQLNIFLKNLRESYNLTTDIRFL